MTSSTYKESPYIGPKIGGFATKLSWYARQKMFESLMQVARVTPETTVLDVGVTSDRREDCNFFERLYPYPQSLTASGMEDASFLEQDYPGLKFVQANGLNLPFADKSFDLVVSFATIAHVGSREKQKAFVRELCRVGRTCFITTPNRWYPVDLVTGFPLIHWLPPAWFRQILTWVGQDFWAREEHFNILSEKDMLSFFPADVKVTKKHFRLFGPISNLLYYVET
ncbi:MAG: class I SAM-dependent methyltransferase [Hydrococcus sp. C42_A2020_068]|uniref:class I SAM-dependent methyltransferase n=1 Tax=Pleurocapsa sp. PCC 7327 TaxID=118163 RepID=UPI00029FEEC5|nr:class I SAM-dependent methyltransferase [Pleurocapsa sp. PCC 7327]AFY79450.1 methylase involved in ubiquinone/menaquinone biosynthesis [Pleurocapsa sp. PCC 7327]MBF2021025.1 class I SAM-dependent methyltransferase [Hydrococcus sp. C42_A2020_068]